MILTAFSTPSSLRIFSPSAAAWVHMEGLLIASARLPLTIGAPDAPVHAPAAILDARLFKQRLEVRPYVGRGWLECQAVL